MATDPYLGRLINGKYRIISHLGEGGFAVVYLARQQRDGHDLGEVVIKVLRPEQAAKSSRRVRFINEARAARKLRSPHAVKVFDLDFDEEGGLPFIVMEYLEGTTLAALLRQQGPLGLQRTLDVGIQIAETLSECHSAEIIHRDLTPGNILLLPDRGDDFVKVLDFGIARMPDASVSQSFLGTPKYMAPEQIRSDELDGGIDIYALGVVLFECLAGQPPIEADTPQVYLASHLIQPPRRLREFAPQMPAILDSLLDSMLAKQRDLRPLSMDDVAARLRAIAETDQGDAPRVDETAELIDEVPIADDTIVDATSIDSASNVRIDPFGATVMQPVPAPPASSDQNPSPVVPPSETTLPPPASIPRSIEQSQPTAQMKRSLPLLTLSGAVIAVIAAAVSLVYWIGFDDGELEQTNGGAVATTAPPRLTPEVKAIDAGRVDAGIDARSNVDVGAGTGLDTGSDKGSDKGTDKGVDISARREPRRPSRPLRPRKPRRPPKKKPTEDFDKVRGL